MQIVQKKLFLAPGEARAGEHDRRARAKGKAGKDAGRASSSATVLTEDKARRGLAAASTGGGAPEWASLVPDGGGQGSIKGKQAGLNCGYTCGSQSASFYSGETVLIAVTLGKGMTSLEWTTGAGTCTGSTEAPVSTYTVPMSSAKELVAEFK